MTTTVAANFSLAGCILLVEEHAWRPDRSATPSSSRAALGGDVASFGLLLERHRAEMRAVAVAMLGYGPAAEDAVQDAMLVALERLAMLSDPAAAGAWLRAVVRNVCRMQLRRAKPTVPLEWDIAAVAAGTEEVIEQHVPRDWIWHAVGQLSEPLQTVVLLRHFGRCWGYAEIAAICGIPVGTVRSRLHEARRQLGASLLATAESAHDDDAALTRRRGERLRGLLDSPRDGTLARAVTELAHPDLVTAGWWGLWVMAMRDERVTQLRLYHPIPPTPA